MNTRPKPGFIALEDFKCSIQAICNGWIKKGNSAKYQGNLSYVQSSTIVELCTLT